MTKLWQLGRRAADHFGRPQDIEWAIDHTGVFWLLQARPITQVRSRADIDEFTNADLKDGGISANSCTPHMFSLYHRAFQRCVIERDEVISEQPFLLRFFRRRGDGIGGVAEIGKHRD